MNNINPISATTPQTSKPLIYKLRTRSSDNQIVETTYTSNKPIYDPTCSSGIREGRKSALVSEIKKEMHNLSLPYTAMGVNKFVLDKLSCGSVFARDPANNIILTKEVDSPSAKQEIGLSVIATKVISLVKKEVSSVYKSPASVNNGATMPHATHAAHSPDKTDATTLPTSAPLRSTKTSPIPKMVDKANVPAPAADSLQTKYKPKAPVIVKKQSSKENASIVENRNNFKYYLSKLFRLYQMDYSPNNCPDVKDLIAEEKFNNIAVKVEYCTYPNYSAKKFTDYYWLNGRRLSKLC